MKTLQEIFDKVATHLLTQNTRSMRDTRTCGYRGLDGLKCAVGCLIGAEHYSADMEGHGVGHRIVEGALKASGVAVHSSSLMMLSYLQTVHDEGEPEEWHEELVKIAEQFKLTMPEIKS